MDTEEENIKKIGRLLELGGTMLASHHQCGAPLFRYQGKTICPVCDFGGEKAAEKILKEIKPREAGPYPEEKEKPVQGEVQTIEKYVVEKIIKIGEDMERETDLSRIKDQMECIEKGIRILKQLK